MIQDINILRDLSLAEKLSRVARLWKMVADRELEPLNLTYPLDGALEAVSNGRQHQSKATCGSA